MFVLDQVPQRLAQTRRDQIRRVAQEYRGALAGLRVLPGSLSHIISWMAKVHAPRAARSG
jgi:hypothetical protein